MTTLGHLLVGRPNRETAEYQAMLGDERRRRGRRGRYVGLVVLMLAAGGGIVALVATGGSHPSTSGNPNLPVVDKAAFVGQGRLAFASGGALFVLDGSTGGLQQVGRLASGAEEPTFSPDGRYLAYLAAGSETDVAGHPRAPFALAAGPLVIADGNGGDGRTVTAVGDVSAATWGPASDSLLVVSGAPYDGSSVSVVSPDGTVRQLVSASTVYGAVWSPDGREVAVAIGRTAGTSTLESLPATGGVPTVWAGSSGPDSQWMVPLGWWNGHGIGVWVGGSGTVPGGAGALDGAELEVVTRPGAALHPLGHTPPQALVPAAASSNGWLAVDLQSPSALGRTPWAKKSIVTCAPGSSHCSTLQEPATLTALDPVWSADGSTLAYVGAPASDVPSFSPGFVAHWYASAQLYEATAGTTTPTAVTGTAGATAPAWSPTGDGLLFVRDDALYLVPRAGAAPQRVAGPLLPAAQWTSTYYGAVDWRFLFAWAR